MAVNTTDLEDPMSRYNLLKRDEYRCAYCGEPLALDRNSCSPTVRWGTRDHIIPRSKGGPNTPDNVVSACYPCNLFKDNNSLINLLRKLLDGPLPWDPACLISKRTKQLTKGWDQYHAWKAASLAIDTDRRSGQGGGNGG